jgi:aldehyde dehydrogenase (NAD+)
MRPDQTPTTGTPLMQAASGKDAPGTAPASPAAPAAGLADWASADWDYAPAPEARDVVSLAAEYGLFVDGEFAPAASGRSFETVNPATEEPLARVAESGAPDVDRAVAAARTAYEQVWGPMPGAERAKYLYRIARLLQERSREFAVLESLDNGKPIKESRDVDIPLAAAHFFYHAGWADKLEHAGFGPSPRPIGVAGQIIPWNFPLLMAAWKLAPALAASRPGCRPGWSTC